MHPKKLFNPQGASIPQYIVDVGAQQFASHYDQKALNRVFAAWKRDHDWAGNGWSCRRSCDRKHTYRGAK